jgi:hypothetical protein
MEKFFVKHYILVVPFILQITLVVHLFTNLNSNELKYQRNLFMVSTFNQTIDAALPTMIIFTSVTFFTLFTSLPLLPSYIVIVMNFYMIVSNSMGTYFTNEVIALISANVSMKRMKV